jgi:hypothetical protein
MELDDLLLRPSSIGSSLTLFEISDSIDSSIVKIYVNFSNSDFGLIGQIVALSSLIFWHLGNIRTCYSTILSNQSSSGRSSSLTDCSDELV